MYTDVISFRAMGSQANVWLDAPDEGQTILQRVPEWVEAIEASLSRFRPDSELSRLNARVGEWVDVSPTMYAAISEARRAARVTAGLVTPLILPALLAAGYDRSFEILMAQPQLDSLPDNDAPGVPVSATSWCEIESNAAKQQVRIPGPLDLGGTAKGWTAAVVADRLAEYGPCLVDLGGDLVGRGKDWSVQLDDPFYSGTPFALLALEDRAVVTSGTDYRRWGRGNHHIIDPRTGLPAVSDLISVTIIHADAVLAEAFAKAVLLQGSDDGLAWLTHYPDAAGLAFDQNGRVLATGNFQTYIQEGA